MVQIRLARRYPRDAKRLIVFLTPGSDGVTGGILSINSVYEETRKLRPIHGAEVAMCVLPEDPPLLKYTKFRNETVIQSLPIILSRMPKLRSMLIHVPEYAICQLTRYYASGAMLQRVKDLCINVMLQNIDLLESADSVRKLAKIGKVTCTTAHRAYSNSSLENQLGCPVHELSVYLSPEQYVAKRYHDKEDLMIVSPDDSQYKREFLDLISSSFPKLRIAVIQNITYERYKILVSRAKWSVTFGEGLDAYFLETVFSGGIGFSVYNTRFFTPDFEVLRTLYPTHEEMLRRICSDMRQLDNEMNYSAYQKQQYDLCAKYYDFDTYIERLSHYYHGFFSSKGSAS